MSASHPRIPALADPSRGIREFIVGTGGANHTAIAQIAANSEVRNTNTYGVLKLTLHSTGYDWKFEHESAGSFSDFGNGCMPWRWLGSYRSDQLQAHIRCVE